jgi:hypothetical protein
LAASALGKQVAKLVEDASQVAGLAEMPWQEAEFYRTGSKLWRERVDAEIDDSYSVSSSFYAVHG